MRKRILSVILLICMLVNNLPAAAFAEGTDSGCSHVCDDSCGFEKAVACSMDCPAGEDHAEGCAFDAGSPCTHKHNGECGVECAHNYAEGICTVCGMAEPCEHTGGTATCKELAVCDTCDKSYGDLADHVYGEDGKCTLCGQEKPCEHTGGTATCKELAVCDTCDKSYGDLADHVYGEDGKCACGTECTHNYAEGKCTLCGMAEPQPVCSCEAKCTEGSINTSCPVCGAAGAELTACGFEETTVFIESWSWVVDEEMGAGVVLDLDGTWVTDLPQVGSLEQVTAALPAYIQVGENQVPIITWQCEDFAETAGTYSFTALLPDGYALAEDAPALKLKVNMGVAEVLETCKHATTAYNSETTLNGGSYYLSSSADIGANQILTISGEVTLCLHGNTLTCNRISIPSGNNTLHLYDCKGGGVIDNKDNWGVQNQGTLNMHGGTISGVQTAITNNGTFTMNGGTLTSGGTSLTVSNTNTFIMKGGSITNSGTNASVGNSGTFTMYGGTITGDQNEAVRNYKSFTMYGGELTVKDGSTTYCVVRNQNSNANFTLKNGTIRGKSGVLGVSNESGGIFNMDGGTITGCGSTSTSGGGVYNTASTFNMNGGTITGNTAKSGGGLYNYIGFGAVAVVNITGGTISGNHVTNNGGGIFNGYNSKLNMSGGTITGNTAGSDGGGIYVDSSTVNLSGSVAIYGNTVNGAPNNFRGKLNLNEATPLTGTIPIGISATGSFSNELTDPEKFISHFTADDPTRYYITAADGKVCANLLDSNKAPDTLTLSTLSDDPLLVGNTTNLILTVTPANAGQGKNLVWSSSEPTVATVDQNGKVEAVGIGDATITVKWNDSNDAKTATYKVTVTATEYPVTFVRDVSLYIVEGNEKKPVASGSMVSPGEKVYIETELDFVSGKKYVPTVGCENAPALKLEEETIIPPTTEGLPEVEQIYSFEMPEGNVTIGGEWKTFYSVSTQVSPKDGGSVSVMPVYAYDGETVTVKCTPADGYEFVSWNEEEIVPMPRSLEEEGTDSSNPNPGSFTMPADDVLITVKFQEAIVITTEPTAKDNLTYTGEAQDLINGGTAMSVTMPNLDVKYCVTMDNNKPDNGATWSTAIPQGKNAGTYYVWYKVIHEGAKPYYSQEALQVTIGKQQVDKPAANNTQFTYSGQDQTYTITTSSLYTIEGNVKKDAGNYTVTVKLNDTANYEWKPAEGETASSENLSYTFTIGRKPIDKPNTDTTIFTYDGNPKTYTVAPSDSYTVTGYTQTNAGDHTVTVTLNSNYCWTGGSIDDVTFDFVIARKPMAMPEADTTVFTYDGTPKTYTVAPSDSYTVTGYTQTNAGDHTVTVTLNSNYAWDNGSGEEPSIENLTFDFKINPKAITVTAADQTITYGKQISTSVDKATAAELVSGHSLASVTLTANEVNCPGGTITPSAAVIKDGNIDVTANYTITYQDGTLTINKADVSRPTTVGKIDETIAAKNDGTITGVTDAMQYQVKGATGWTSVETGKTEVTGLADGTYLVRYKEDANHNASPTTEIVIEAGDQLTVTTDPELKNQVGFTFTADPDKVDYNGSTTLTLVLKEEYSKLDTFAITHNDTDVTDQLTADNKLTLSDLTQDATVAISGIGDTVAPVVTVTMKPNAVNTLLRVITFGIVKEKQTVTITATDGGSRIKDISYYVADKELTEAEITRLTWNGYIGSFDLDKDGTYVVYAKAADNSGNTTTVNSEGIIVDQSVPQITGVENGQTYYGDQTITIDDRTEDTNGTALTVRLDGEVVTPVDNKVTIPANNAERTITVTDEAGNVTEYKITVYKIYTVTFVADGNTIAEYTQAVNHAGDADMNKTIPHKNGYDDKAPIWSLDGETAADGKNITADTTFTAVYYQNAPGVYEDSTNSEGNAAGVEVENSIEELKAAVPMTEDELQQITWGEDVKIWMVSVDDSSTISAEDKTLVDNARSGDTVGMYLDIDLFKQIGDNNPVQVTTLNEKIAVTLDVPASLINSNTNKIRTYYVIRIHNGEATVIEPTFDAANRTLTFETDRFSTYAITYKDTSKPAAVTPATGDNSHILMFTGMSVTCLLCAAMLIAFFPRKKGMYER